MIFNIILIKIMFFVGVLWRVFANDCGLCEYRITHFLYSLEYKVVNDTLISLGTILLYQPQSQTKIKKHEKIFNAAEPFRYGQPDIAGTDPHGERAGNIEIWR